MIKVALVGCGRIAKRHSDLLGNNLIKNSCLKAVCDIDPEKARNIGEKHNVPYYYDMDEMMKKEDIDLVSVLTESGNHAKHVINLSKYGKNIIVEKPMALTIEDAELMIKACEENSCLLFVVMQNRFNKPVVKLREAIEKNKFGKLVMGTVRVRWCRKKEYYNQASWRGTWAMDGGVLANQASHHIDLLEWMMGDIESIYAKSIHALADIEAEDTAVAVLKFKNGALGIIEATTATRPYDLEGSISILGEKGTVEIGGFAVNKMLHWNFTDETEEENDILENYYENPPDVYGFGHKLYYNNVIDTIINGEKQFVDGYEGKKSLEVITAIYKSIEINNEIELPLKDSICKLGRL